MSEPSSLQCPSWLEDPITFDQCSHLSKIPHPRTYPLIVGPIIDPKRLSKVLMNGERFPMSPPGVRRGGVRSVGEEEEAMCEGGDGAQGSVVTATTTTTPVVPAATATLEGSKAVDGA